MSNLQKATGSLLRRAHGVPEGPRESFGASSWVAALAGFEAVAGDAAGSCCLLVVFSGAHSFKYGGGCGRHLGCAGRSGESTLGHRRVSRRSLDESFRRVRPYLIRPWELAAEPLGTAFTSSSGRRISHQRACLRPGEQANPLPSPRRARLLIRTASRGSRRAGGTARSRSRPVGSGLGHRMCSSDGPSLRVLRRREPWRASGLRWLSLRSSPARLLSHSSPCRGARSGLPPAAEPRCEPDSSAWTCPARVGSLLTITAAQTLNLEGTYALIFRCFHALAGSHDSRSVSRASRRFRSLAHLRGTSRSPLRTWI